METQPVGRRRLALGVLVGLLVFIASLAIVVIGARPRTEPDTAFTDAGQPAKALNSRCALFASDAAGLAQQVQQAVPGQTICLKSGDYGSFYGGRKSGPVGIRARSGAQVKMSLEFDSVANLRIDGVMITSASIGGDTRNLTIANSRFTGLAVVHADQFHNANVVFDHNVHANIDTCTTCYQGRLHIEGDAAVPSGIVVTNSVFSGGDSDGVRPDAYGVQVIHNEFYGFRDRDPFHTDPIQIYGGRHVVIRGNYFHDNAVSAQIMMADGGDHNIVEDNVVSGTGYTWAITWFSDDGSIIRHNTFAGGRCNGNVPCGMLNLGAKAGDPRGRGTVIRDNVMGGISDGDTGGTSAFEADHNLTAKPLPGTHNIVGAPRYRGPLGVYSGYRLAPGSLGARRASDGSDPGIR